MLDQVRDVIRLKHYSLRTERSYCDWIARFIRYHNKRHPREIAEPELTAFLTHLARDGNVAASTQNQALSALLFDSFAPPAHSASRPARLTRGYPRRSALYKEVLKEDLPKLPEPAIGDIVARTIGCPLRWIHLAVGAHRDFVSLDLAATVPQVADEFFAGVELGPGRLAAVEIADEADA